jgi:hypothetical protein
VQHNDHHEQCYHNHEKEHAAYGRSRPDQVCHEAHQLGVHAADQHEAGCEEQKGDRHGRDVRRDTRKCGPGVGTRSRGARLPHCDRWLNFS